MRTQCTCTDCAQSEDIISKLSPEVSEVWLIHTATKKNQALGLWEGDECEVDHNHAASKSCSIGYKCDKCDDKFESESEAESCCAGWVCNYCGWVYSNSWNPRSDAANCCVTSCDECGTTGWPSYLEDHSCSDGMGMRRQLPWEARGVTVDARDPEEDTNWKVAYALEPEKHNVVRAAADYYLLEAITAGMVGTTDGKGTMILAKTEGWNEGVSVQSSSVFRVIKGEAQELMDALVAKWDPILINYVHMAVGGELRHHTAVGSEVLSTNRDRAWCGWRLIFDAVGPDALTDAAELFREFTSTGFGGEPWANACEILHARLTGQLKPQMFLDRVFNAQHNGGCLMNKVSWYGDGSSWYHNANLPIDKAMSLSELTSYVLPAHGATPEPDYPTLLAYASPEVVSLFNDSYEFAAHAAIELGLSLNGRRVKPSRGQTQYEARKELIAQQAKQAELAAKQSKVEKFYLKWEHSNQAYLAALPAAEQNKLDHEAYKAAPKNQESCGCGCGETYDSYSYFDTYPQDMANMYEEQVRYYAGLLLNALAEKGQLFWGFAGSTGAKATLNKYGWEDITGYSLKPFKVADKDSTLYAMLKGTSVIIDV